MAAEAADLHLTTMRELGQPIPDAQDLEAVRADTSWATENQTDRSNVVISMIKLDWRSRADK